MHSLPIPKPISLNNIFANKNAVRTKVEMVGGAIVHKRKQSGGRVKTKAYIQWRNNCAWTMKSAGPTPQIKGPVSIHIIAPSQGVSADMDTDNTIKGYLDTLVLLGVIEDDNRKIVRRLTVEWVDLPQGEIRVEKWDEG